MRDRAIFAIGCMLIAYFILSAIFFWGYNLAILALGLVMALLAIKRLRARAFGLFRNLRRPLRVVFVSLLALILASVVIIEGLVISHAAEGGWMERSDYLLILGASIKGGEPLKSLQGRLDKGLEYLQKYPGTRVIVSGGLDTGESITEAEAMKRYLVKHGVAPGTIIKEERSTSTYENFLFTKAVLGHAAISGKTSFTVVTNDFHIFRSRLLAKRQGYLMYPLSSHTLWYLAPNCYAREYFAVIKSFILDR